MQSGHVVPVDFVLFITVSVLLGVNGGEGSVGGLILLCFLSISLSVRLCGSRDMEEDCTFSRLNFSMGERIVLLFAVMVSRVSGALV